MSGLTSVDSGVITGTAAPTNPTVVGAANPSSVLTGATVLLTATVAPGANPTSSDIQVTGDTTSLGGAANTVFHDDGTDGDITAGDNVFSHNVSVPSSLAGGPQSIPVNVVDAQSRTASTTIAVNVLGSFTIFHANDTHARVTPHKWVIPNPGWAGPVFEDVGGAVYLAAAIEQYTADPNSLFIDGGDISEGNPIGDMNGNGTMASFYIALSDRLKGMGRRGIDAVVVGNHDVRDANYIANLMDMRNNHGVPVISANVCNKDTHDPYFAASNIVTVNGTKIGILGYTTDASEVGASLSNTIDVVKCDWNSTDSTKIHLSSLVNDLRNQGCNIVILAAHVGHTAIATDSTDGTIQALLKDDPAIKVPEVAITGHWHTWASTVWQPESLNYKTIFAESGSYMKYLGELKVDGQGRYISSAQHVIRNSDYQGDSPNAKYVNPAIELLIQGFKNDYDSSHPIAADQVIGYTADDLLLDNKMKWWSADEYPWSGNNTAGQFICDGMKWKASQPGVFGQCDLSIEAGGGVRADIPKGQVTFTQVYEMFPWSDDKFYRVNMTGQDIMNFLKATNCDAGFSSELAVKAHDGVPTAVTVNGSPIDLNHVYTVAINSYMYANPPSGYTWTDNSPLTSPVLCRDGLVDFMQQQHSQASSAYHVGDPRYALDTEFSGGYRAVVTMMNDNDQPSFDDAFIRFIGATPDTLIRLGSNQVPTWFVQPDGTVDPTNRLSEIELYRSYLGFKQNALHQGDIIEVWGKGSFYSGDPEFVDQEGIYADGVEFKIIGNDPSLAKPTFVSSAAAVFDDNYKNHYIKFLAGVTGPSTARDQFGRVVTVWDATGFATKGSIGNVGDFVFLTGVPTSESFTMRFRCDKVEPATGVTSFPTPSNVASNVAAVAPLGTTGQVTLTANASATPSALYPTDDAQVSSGSNYATKNYGSSTSMYVQSSTGSYGNERGWLKFDLSKLSLPPGATIAQATLSTWCWSASGPALAAELHSADDTWTEGTLTWNSQPAIGSVIETQTLASGTTSVSYDWDVTAYVQQQLQGDQLASFVLKAQTESLATSSSYTFDTKEYKDSGVWPRLTITTASSATVASMQYYYRYSADGTIWTDWAPAATTPSSSSATTAAINSATTTTYTEQFALPNGYGYYEFYSQATDNQRQSESAPMFAQASEHYLPYAPYPTQAIVLMSNLSQTYSGAPLPATITTVPASLTTAVTYVRKSDQSVLSGPPVHPDTYTVTANITQQSFTGSDSETFVILPAAQTITFNPLTSVKKGAAAFALAASTTSGLPITYTSSDASVATVSGNIVTVVSDGTTTITASQAGNTDYLPATSVDQQLAVTKDIPQVPAAPRGLIYVSALGLLAAGVMMLRRRSLAQS